LLGLPAGRRKFPRSGAGPCLHADTVTAEELGRVIMKVADQQPDLLHEDMVYGLGFALGFTYPCAKEKAD